MIDDFISQSSFEGGVRLPEDALAHEKLAASVLDKAQTLPRGSVIAVQGAWGQGKTDVLARIKQSVDDGNSGKFRKTIWINPWQYGTPDLLTPVVSALLEILPNKTELNTKTILKLVESLVVAGLNFGLKASSKIVPGMELLDLAAKPAANLVKGIFQAVDMGEALSDKSIPDADPVAAMGERFRELVEYVLADAPESRLLICIDDLDRCLPDRQVSLLEAIRFLTSAGAPATFLVAIDPTLARQAVRTQYGSDAFDPDRYLDKLFHIRISLPAKTGIDVRNMFELLLRRPLEDQKGTYGDALKTLLGENEEALPEAAENVITVMELRNPRLLQRIATRLLLLARSHDELLYREPLDLQLLIAWFAMIERWPGIRAALQDAGLSFGQRWECIAGQVPREEISPEEKRNIIRGGHAVVLTLKNDIESPDLNQFILKLETICDQQKTIDTFQQLDKVMRESGL